MSITMSRMVSYFPNKEEIVTDYVGSTLWVRPETWQIMSDEWDTIMTATSITETGALTRTCVNNNTSDVIIDANDEAFQRYWDRIYQNRVQDSTNTAEKNANTIRKGDQVHVYKGKHYQGAIGKVVVIMDGSYGMGYRSTAMHKYGIATSDRMGPVVAKNGKTYNNYLDMIWAWECNTELVGDPHPVTDEIRIEIECDARKEADHKTADLRKSAAHYNGLYNKKVA